MDIRSIVPLIRQSGIARHASFEEQLQTAVPVAEVDDADGGAFSDAENLLKYLLRITHFLKSVAQHDKVVGVIISELKFVIKFRLNDRNSVGNAACD